ncbi:MAG: MaoC family dehydratase [Rhodospirillaceae bacterium]|jgi:acyl dehydratase|nr:MaoC family dehydratase [Rhodospirillaceae bacterium]MBT4689018.1 MaoC family dehydratase [Rhodospirillaceae bacterium]MBT5082157.1 MaoC family dehydratase [Rhodospirillaceae bacterium]MBT5523630.1 MaoC family dehydratase [Rhodospirillaceae bacterium]MBT5879073.1 MaoC family dehydratase [Rhodospirillaceae bacterium]
MTYLEDIVVGAKRSFGHYEVTAAEIIDYGKLYDDQPFHTDPEAAKDSVFGGLIASGWHTCAMFMRMACDAQDPDHGLAGLGSPGFDDLKWLMPVRPGDILSAQTKVLSATPSRSKHDRGTVRIQIRIFNQKDEAVLEMISMGRYLRRPAEATAET